MRRMDQALKLVGTEDLNSVALISNDHVKKIHVEQSVEPHCTNKRSLQTSFLLDIKLIDFL